MMDAAQHAPNWFERTDDGGAGCYVHLPFCDRICPYCDFAVVSYRAALVDRYVEALVAEIERSKANDDFPSSQTHALQTLYFGGGTPSALPPAALGRVTRALFERFDTSPGSIEFTLEANPSRNVEDVGMWLEMGVNRLSIGVQSFDDGELHRLGRSHDAKDAATFVRAARTAGFANISLDVIAGVPGQTRESLRRSLAAALELEPTHLSVYALTIESGTPYERWHRRDASAFPNDDAVASLLESAHETLARAGFVHYEISNFARPGFASAHNYGYWRQRECFAFGLSAAGYRDGTRYVNLRALDAYCAAVERGASPAQSREHLDGAARAGEAAMLALRTSQGIDYADFARRFAIDARTAWARASRKCMAAGLLEVDERGMRLTSAGRLLANTVCAEFLEPANHAVAVTP
jgi:putative oxygen-independent coproporphyrinogen III oxidase